MSWVGVLVGKGRRGYVSGSFKTLKDSPDVATRFGSREEALNAARQAKELKVVKQEGEDWKPMHYWATDVEAEEVE
jgi:hypothetical protein